MSRTSRLIPAILLACALAACGEAGSTPVGPEGPSLDTGVGSGGANREEGDVAVEGDVTVASETVPADTTTNRSGVGSGGAN
jgi:hypothetical protein